MGGGVTSSQWRIQRILDGGLGAWAPKLCAQIDEKQIVFKHCKTYKFLISLLYFVKEQLFLNIFLFFQPFHVDERL